MSIYNARIKELEDLIHPLREELSRLQQLHRTVESPFQLGDIISWGTQRGRVIRIGVRSWAVMRIRKDGSTGSEVQVYIWHKPTKEL
jgi:small-conductance mechanosensitive channel